MNGTCHIPLFYIRTRRQGEKSSYWCCNFPWNSLINAFLTAPDLLQNLIHFLSVPVNCPRSCPPVLKACVEVIPSCLFVFCGGRINQLKLVFQYVNYTFASKDSPTCTKYALKRTATDNTDKLPKAAQSVQTNFYKDDYLEPSPTFEGASRKAKVVNLLSVSGFNLTKLGSNEPNTLQ